MRIKESVSTSCNDTACGVTGYSYGRLCQDKRLEEKAREREKEREREESERDGERAQAAPTLSEDGVEPLLLECALAKAKKRGRGGIGQQE